MRNYPVGNCREIHLGRYSLTMKPHAYTTTPRDAHVHPVRQFGALLREWRQARKLSQLELAHEAGISQRHLSFLESGRSNAGRETVIGLSMALDLPLRERNRLLGAAGFAPMYLSRSLDLPEMTPIRSALERTLAHHEPFPAIVVDHQWNMVMENRSAVALSQLFDDPDAVWRRTCGDGPRNLVRVTFHREGIRPYIKNWHEVGPILLNRIRREAAAKPGAGIDRLLDDLLSDPDVPHAWHAPDWHLPLNPLCLFHVGKGDLGFSLFSMLTTFGTPQDVTVDELRIETFFPHDVQTEALLRSLPLAAI